MASPEVMTWLSDYCRHLTRYIRISLFLYELGIAPKPLKHPLAFNFTAEARRDRIFTAGSIRKLIEAVLAIVSPPVTYIVMQMFYISNHMITNCKQNAFLFLEEKSLQI